MFYKWLVGILCMVTVVNHTQVKGYYRQPSKRSAGNGGQLTSTYCNTRTELSVAVPHLTLR